MKKLVVNILFLTIFAIAFTSCKSTKEGCGLTSDAQKMEQTITTETTVLAEV